MAVASRPAKVTELQILKRWKDREASPERTKVWTEPNNKGRSDRKVPVIYYICRNGHLQHPHFMEVHLSSPHGLYLKDVINRLNQLRGKGMASMYSWSSKRSYKSGYVWQDLSENDFIYPAHGQEYILKGSELLEASAASKSDEALAYSSTINSPPENQKHGVDDHDFPAPSSTARRRRNQSWSSFDIHEYKVYAGESAGRPAADASTQTNDKRRRQRAIRENEEVDNEVEVKNNENFPIERQRSRSTEIISTDEISEISPPPLDSSPETLETLMKADARLILRSGKVNDDPSVNGSSQWTGGGRNKASTVLMQLLSCGSIGFKYCGPGHGSLVSHYKVRLPRGGGANPVEKDVEDDTVRSLESGFGGKVKLEDKEYFSGSLIETKKDEFPALKRSSSYNADRCSEMELEVQEFEGGTAKCLQRKPKASSSSSSNSSKMKKGSNNIHEISWGSSSSTSSPSITCCSTSEHGSKRIA